MRSVLNYLNEVKVELSKVTWPKKQEVLRLTLVVLIISVVVAGYVSGLDYVFTKILEKIVK